MLKITAGEAPKENIVLPINKFYKNGPPTFSYRNTPTVDGEIVTGKIFTVCKNIMIAGEAPPHLNGRHL